MTFSRRRELGGFGGDYKSPLLKAAPIGSRVNLPVAKISESRYADLMQRTLFLFSLAGLFLGSLRAQEEIWQPDGDRLKTKWASQIDPNRPLPDYPRPQMVRQVWGNLNGLWDYAITGKDASEPNQWEGKILVPFAIESSLSGVGKTVGEDKKLWYHTKFQLPNPWRRDRLMLRFGAVDWHATVWVNDKKVGEHRGGYTPFDCDISDALAEGKDQKLVVSVWDPTDAGYQPRGKQVREPRGIWYTSVTGIWQTVWLEPVPKTSIGSLKIVPDIDAKVIRVTPTGLVPETDLTVKVEAGAQREIVASVEGKLGQEIVLPIEDPQLWSPDRPFLYGLRVQLLDAEGGLLDSVTSYTGMRKIALGKDDQGRQRLFLNDEPVFMFGPLDQGWWPDGLYTAPTDEALKYDIQVTKDLGFNTARKHVKVEPARWYYWCDVLGLLVWQDLPNGDKHIRGDDPDLERTPESEATFRQEYREMVEAFGNHPSIVVWVPFNEGWGQFKTNEILAWAKELDPTRLVDGPSGWTDRGEGDILDIHRYPGPAMPELEENRAVVLGEFGGLGWPVSGHLWWNKRNWGYRTYQSADELWTNYKRLIGKLRPLIGNGLAAAIYTQTTDVEGEVNGLMTYDRKRVKFDIAEMKALNETVYGPQPSFTRSVLVPTSEAESQTWRFVVEKPDGEWFQPNYDDASWKSAPGGFGTEHTPGAVVKTEWASSEIWLRRTITLTNGEQPGLHWRIHHDEDATVYLNGMEVETFRGYTAGYEDLEVSAATKAALQDGENVIAIHCKQTTGGQYIDIGLVNVVTKAPSP